MTPYVFTSADKEIRECLDESRSFLLVAGAGSGKTTSLVEALKVLLKCAGPKMLRDGQQAVCITYTNRAADVIRERLRQNELYIISTLHSFLWGEIRHFQKSIRAALRRKVLPDHIAKQKERDNGGASKAAVEARVKAAELESSLAEIDSVQDFRYGDDTPFSNYLRGEIGHDDLIAIAADILRTNLMFRRVISQKYPYIFVDEAQDTSPDIVDAFNSLAGDERLPIVGYFGDPMQQIYEKGAGDFIGPSGARRVTKVENFRSAPQIITLLNAFRSDLTQVAAGENATLNGSVEIMLVRAEKPEAARGRYSESQLKRAHQRLTEAIELWGWSERKNTKQLFLVWRMIARRVGFLPLHDLFNGPYASSRAKNDYEQGVHYLLRPFTEIIVPLVTACRHGSPGAIMRVLTSRTLAFRPGGTYSTKSVRDVKGIANDVTVSLAKLFDCGKLGDVLRFCRDAGLIQTSERLNSHLNRSRRQEKYDEEKHSEEKADWLADAFFSMQGTEIESYCRFLDENTPYSTQHGVKGEQYDDVIVVFDDVEAAWSNYSFAKTLTPQAAGEPKDSQKERSRKLAYVCFSRAVRNLRILLFTPNPEVSARELESLGLFQSSQISFLGLKNSSA